MRATKKFWIGPLLVAGLMLTAFAGAQTFPSIKGNNQGTGRNATPGLVNPGRAFLTWFRPNANDVLSGAIIRNNSAALGASVTFTGGFQPSPGVDEASFPYDQPATGDLPTDLAQGSAITPSYHYAFNGGAAQTFSWIFDPQDAPVNQPGVGTNFARSYALWVHLPIGSTVVAGIRRYTQRYFVYQISYGPGGLLTYTEVVDTYAAGQGWVQLGNAGDDTNRMFPYDGTTPIRITLTNNIYVDNNGNPTDVAGQSLVYADAARAIPQVGEMVATPTMAALGAGPIFVGRAIGAVNKFSIGTRNGETVTLSQGEVTSYNYQDGSIDTGLTGRRWTFRPAEQAFTTTMDNLVANNVGFVSNPLPPGPATGLGTNYLTAPLIAAPATSTVTYAPTLEDGEYEIQMYLSPDALPQQFGNAVQVEVHEGAAINIVTIDMNRGPGWYVIPGGRYTHVTGTDPLSFVVTNAGSAADVLAGKLAYADAVRFIGAFDSEVNSTPTSARITMQLSAAEGGGTADRDVVIVAAEDGRIYCLDAVGNADGTTNVYWAYPSIPDQTNVAWTDPNNTGTGIDGTLGVTLAEMPIGFGKSSPIVQRIGGVDYVFVAATNGRVYCINAAGRGDYNLASRLPGTTSRNWSYPNDYPGQRVASALGNFTSTSIVYAELGGVPRLYVPTNSGHMYALDPVGNAVTGDTTVLWDFPGRTTRLAPITTIPAVFNGRIYFGTTIDDNGVGHFYSVDAANGSVFTAQEFIPGFGEPGLGAFRGGPAAVDGLTIGLGAPDTIFVANNNLNVYALEAANINNVIWRTNELNTTVSAPLTFTPIDAYVIGGFTQVQPTVVVPGDNGQWSALFARGGAGLGITNGFGGKFAWGKVAASGITAGTSVGAPVGSPGFLYGGDLAGNIFAFSNTNTLPGQGEPPISDIVEPDNPDGAVWRDAKIKVIDKLLYESLRADPTLIPYGAVNGLIQAPPYAFEWGQTAFFVVYDFPFQRTLNGVGGAQAPALVNFQISTEGATTRQFSVQARAFPVGAPGNRDGYAVLAFAIQGSGQNSLPPGRGRVSYSVTPSRSAGTQINSQVAQNPNNFLEFQVANPLALDITPGANDEIGVTTLTASEGALVNGSPNLASTGLNNETLLTAFFGQPTHSTTGNTTIRVYDRSWMTFLRGPNRGLDQVRVQRPELEWLGGSLAIRKQIPTLIFGTNFEDLPDDRPNTSLDYPNIRAENVRITKDPNGSSENPGYSGVFLRPPTTAGGTPLVNEADAPARLLQPTPFLFEVDVPRFQPTNNASAWVNSASINVPSGYSGRVNIFVDSDNNGTMNTVGGRLEAYRGFWLNGQVAEDESLQVRTPNVDLGSLPGGAGYSPFAPATAGSTFSPWPAGSTLNLVPFGAAVGASDYVRMFKHFNVENTGNVNLLNLRVAKATNDAVNGRLSWGIFSSSVDELGWLDSNIGVWSDIDINYSLTSQVILQKSRVGDRAPAVLQTNPTIRPNPNLNTVGGKFLNLTVPGAASFNGVRFGDDPRIAVTLPIGFPVGTYSQVMRVIEDTLGVGAGSESLALNGTNALEAYSDPGFTLSYKARETRLTNDFTRTTASMVDDPGVLGTAGAAFLHQNLQPAASRVSFGLSIGHMLVAWTSTRGADVALQPGRASSNDQYRIYLAGLDGNNGVPTPGSDPTNAISDLTGFTRSTATKWFTASPSSTNGYPGAAYLYPTVAGESVVPGTEKYGAAVLPARGQVNTVNGILSNIAQFANYDMAFIGEAQKQNPTGRIVESRLFTTRVAMQANGSPVADASPYPMPYDVYSQKGRPSIVRLGDLLSTPAADDVSFITYSAISAGNSRIFWTSFNYNARADAVTGGYTQPQAIEFGEGFESVSSPSVSVRPYTGAGTIGSALFDLSFTGKLRGRKNSEVYLGRLPTSDPSNPVNFPEIFNEKLVPDSETGVFRAKGIEWDLTPTATNPDPVRLRLRNAAGALTDIEVPGTRRLDKNTSLIVMDTTLGGKAYIDPRLGSVRLSTGLPLTTQSLVLEYTPKFIRVSTGTTAGYTGVSMFQDSRVDGVQPPGKTKYWARPNNTSIIAGDNPRVNRFWFSYNRAAAGAGQAARPFMKTMRLGVQLPFQIYTDQAGNIAGLTVIGATDLFQVDPVKGRIYFSPADEDRQVTINYSSIDPSTGLPIPGFFETLVVSTVSESDEAPVPIEQAVNESNMIAFPDPFDNPLFPRPNLVWMFWSSTRGGSPDLYFQTVAPRFAPQPSRN